MILATHADADHTQGLARAREVLKCKVAAHPRSVAPLQEGDEILTYARIDAQNIHIPMPRCKVDVTIDEGDVLKVGDRTLEVWSTPGHTAGQLAFRRGPLLFSGDNIFRDGCVGVIDAHHGSNLVDFIASLRRIRDCDAEFLLPSHGPIFRKDDALPDATIARLESYTHLGDLDAATAAALKMVPDISYIPKEGDRVYLYGLANGAPVEQIPILSDMTAYDKYARCLQDHDSLELASLEEHKWLQYAPLGTHI